jgi:DNA-binding transcriptional MerR regulator
MTRGKQTTALALAGAIALASGAYALGTEADDGAAVAKSPSAAPRDAGAAGRPGFVRGPRGFGHGPGGPLLDGAADRLGVSEEKLRTALEDLAKEHRDDIATQLAGALGVDRAKVQAAFDKLRAQRTKGPDRPRRPGVFANALAKQLGISAAKVRAALESHRGGPTSPDQLAEELGVTEQQLRDAFHALMDKLRPRGRGRPGLTGLAKALGVTQAQLDAAFDKLRDNQDKLRDQFATELAAKLGIDAQKVQDVLDDIRPFGFGRHRHHP